MITTRTAATIGATLSLALAVFAAAPAWAHHSASMYDSVHPMVIKGVVQSFEWTNPHGRIVVVLDTGADVGKVWEVETTAPGRLARDGWTRRSVKPGDHVEVKVAPAHNGTPVGNLLDAKNLDTGMDLGR